MNRKEKARCQGGRQGFTLAELIVGILAAAILALTATVVLVSTFKGWLNVNRAVDMQRDAYIAMDTLTRAVHRGTSMTFANGTFTVNYAESPPNYSSIPPSSKFYANGDDFFAISPPDATGRTVCLVYNKVKFFNVSVVSNPATIWLVLTNNVEISSNQVILARRN